MTSKALANEAFLEEYNRLELELKQLQHELSDSVVLNDELTKVIAQKEDELVAKDKRLESLRERNLADGEQLDLELLTLTEKYNFEVSAKEEIVRKLEIQYKKYGEIERENSALRETIENLEGLLDSNREEHAVKMHEKNLEMKVLREVMEKKMRDQLNKMDISYQKDAFAALSDRHKKAMFQNAKLKDEVALQGVGLNNLGSRLGKQNQQHDMCLKQLRDLNQKLKALKERLAMIAQQKIEIARKREEVQAIEKALLEKRASLRSRLDADPRTPVCAEHRERLHTAILNTRCDVVLWTRRLLLLQDLHVNIKPVYEYELAGRYNPKTFPLEASVSLHSTVKRDSQSMQRGVSSAASVSSRHSDTSRTFANMLSRGASPTRSLYSAPGSPEGANAGGSGLGIAAERSGFEPSMVGEDAVRRAQSPPVVALSFPSSQFEASASLAGPPLVRVSEESTHSKAVPMMIKPAELEELIERDPSLGVALAPLRGKEAQILVTMPDEAPNKKKPAVAASAAERDQNMIAWITLKIVDIWETTRQETERLRTEKHAILEELLDNLHSQTAAASFYSNSSNKHSERTLTITGAGGVSSVTANANKGAIQAPAGPATVTWGLEQEPKPGQHQDQHQHEQEQQTTIDNLVAALRVNTDCYSEAGEEHEDTGLAMDGTSPVIAIGPKVTGAGEAEHMLATANTAAKIPRPVKPSLVGLPAGPNDADDGNAPSAVAQGEEMLSLLSETAKSMEAISALTSVHPSGTNLQAAGATPTQPVPSLPFHSIAATGAEHGSLGEPLSPLLDRQAQRDWIESGELDEDAVHQLWDEVFMHPSAFASSQGSMHINDAHLQGQACSPCKGTAAAWLKPVFPAKRYPVTTEHLKGATIVGKREPKKSIRVPRPGSPPSRPQTGDQGPDNEAPSLRHSVTTELLTRDITRPTALSSGLIGPPVVIHEKTHDIVTQDMRRSTTLPLIPSATKIDRSLASLCNSVATPDDPPSSGLEVTEDGLVLRDPLLGKKFAAQRKALVENAAKAAAALRRASAEFDRGNATMTTATASAFPRQKGGMRGRESNKHSMSAGLLGIGSGRK